MGSKPWQNLSALVLAGAALVGCNNTPQKTDNSIGMTQGNPPWKSSQTAQVPPPAPTPTPTVNANQSPSGFAAGQQVPSGGAPGTFQPTIPPYGGVGGGSVTPPSNPTFNPATFNPNAPLPSGPEPLCADAVRASARSSPCNRSLGGTHAGRRPRAARRGQISPATRRFRCRRPSGNDQR